MQTGGYLLRRRRRTPVRRSRRRRTPSRRRVRRRTMSKSPRSRSRSRTMTRRKSPSRRRRLSLRRRRTMRSRMRRGRGTVKIIKLKGRTRLGGDTTRKDLQKMKFKDLRRGVRMFSLL